MKIKTKNPRCTECGQADTRYRKKTGDWKCASCGNFFVIGSDERPCRMCGQDMNLPANATELIKTLKTKLRQKAGG